MPHWWSTFLFCPHKKETLPKKKGAAHLALAWRVMGAVAERREKSAEYRVKVPPSAELYAAFRCGSAAI